MSKINCILYPPTIDYDFMVQRPQQLMKGFSERGILTYFLNKPLYNSRPGIRQINPSFYVFNQVDIMTYLKDTRPIVYFHLPAHIEMVQKYRPALVVFDSVDEPSEEFASWNHHYYRALQLSDVVLATSDKLFNTASRVNPNTHLVRNGCDYDYFCQASHRNLPIPEDMQNITRPVIGFMGSVATWCDLELVDRLAVNFPDCSIVMIGPLYNVDKIPQRSNLYWLRQKPYEQLIAYVQNFDVGIIPFKMSSMVEAVNPIKMWEYLAAGIPVVSTALPEAKKYQQVVLYSENEAHFMQNIKMALYKDTPERRRQRMEVALENSWSVRARQVMQIMEQALANRDFSAPRLAFPGGRKNIGEEFRTVTVTASGRPAFKHYARCHKEQI